MKSEPAAASVEGDAPWSGTDRFAVVRCIGKGGMGVVYEAFDRERGEVVALKKLPTFNADGLYRFKHEFRTLADLHHPNLVHLYELLASEKGEIFFTMELVDGTDFAQYVRDEGATRDSSTPTAVVTAGRGAIPSAGAVLRARSGAPPARMASRANGERLGAALRQLVRGVYAIHSAGKLHRDLKPSNVLVTPEGRVVILDFGVAADLSALGRLADASSAEVVGTATYMAPEQVVGDEAPDPASDWYSVGVMLYEALVGQPPFVGSTMDVLALKNAIDPTLPSDSVEGIPPDLEALCMSLLQRDPALRPRGDEILSRLGVSQSNDPPALFPASATSAVLVGREQALRALRDAIGATRAGASVTVRIGGASGMGKSTIVNYFLDRLVEGRGAVILRGRAYEREAVPYKAVDSAIDALSRHLMRLAGDGDPVSLPDDIWALGQLFPVLQRVPGVTNPPSDQRDEDLQTLRRRAFDALRELLATLGARQTLVLFVDDAQWGDIDSAALLLDLLRPPAPPPLLLLMTYRADAAVRSPFLDEFRDRWPEGAEVRDLTIGPLELEDAERLALALLEETDDWARGMARAIAREAAGSPFLIEELARSNRGQARVEGPTLSALTLDQLVGQRLGRLSEGPRRVAELVAVAGRPLPMSVIATAFGVDHTINEIVDLLSARRIVRAGLRDGREVVEMTHDRIRETVVKLLPATVVRDHHARLAATFEDTPESDLEAIADHMLGAGDSEGAARWTERAAEQAASKLAFDQAARLFRRAKDGAQRSEADAHRLQVRLAQMLEGAGRSSDAADEYRKAARRATAIERIELERSAAEQLVLSGRIDEGAVAMRRVLAAMGMRAPNSALGAVFALVFYRLWQRVFGLRFSERGPGDVSREDRVRVEALRAVSAGLGTVDIILGACMQARHLLLATALGDRMQLLRAMCVELVQFSTRSHSESKRERAMVEVARGLAGRAGDEGQLYFDGTRGLALYLRGRFPEALAILDPVVAGYRKTPHRTNSTNFGLFAVFACFFSGQLRDEARRGRLLLREVEDRGDVYSAVCLRTRVMVDVALVADDPDEARRHLREAMASWTQKGFNVQHWYAMASEAVVELYVGDGPRAYARIERDAMALKKSFLLYSSFIRGYTAYIRGCCAVASAQADPSTRPARIHEARRMARQLERDPAGWSRALGSLVRGAAENAAGERSQSVEALRLAVQRAEAAGMLPHAWAARYQLGSLLGGDEGGALVAQAENAMTIEGVRAPVRMVRFLLPGLWSSRSS